MNKQLLYIFTTLIIIPLFFFLVILPANAATARSCTLTSVGNPSADFPVPDECKQRLPCLKDELRFVCAYRNIVEHNVHPDGSYWDWHPPGHMGVDLIARANTPIYALENGTVIESYFDRGCGNIVKIQESNGRRHLHCHMIRPGIAKNTPVKRGDIIGYVGHTGGNTSPTDHVHYQVTNGSGVWDNPEVILKNWPNY